VTLGIFRRFSHAEILAAAAASSSACLSITSSGSSSSSGGASPDRIDVYLCFSQFLPSRDKVEGCGWDVQDGCLMSLGMGLGSCRFREG
jgi:hypothetical protein